MSGWSAELYATFAAERTRPARDLLATVAPRAVGRAVDLGCGPGNSTALLASRWPDAAIEAVDTAPDMVAAARRALPGVAVAERSIEDWAAGEAGTHDLVLSNAALQWVAHHELLLPRLAGRLAPGGTLAVQVPDNLDTPPQRIMRVLARAPEFAPFLDGVDEGRAPILPPDAVHALLGRSCARVETWRTEYHHVLPGGPGGVVEWFAGTGLLPFLRPLPPPLRATFLARYRDAVASAVPLLPDGAALLAMPRLFIVATR